jgi:type IV pilus assembly protein PilB
MDAKQTVDLFIESGIISPELGIELVQESLTLNKRIDRVFLDRGITDQETFYKTIADSLGVDYFSLDNFEPEPNIINLIPAGLARLHRALPIGVQGNTLIVALEDPFNLQAAEELHFALNLEIQTVVAPPARISELINKYYGSETASMDEILAQLGDVQLTIGGQESESVNLQELASEASSAPIIRYVDLILDKAIQARASDIHLEPFESEFKIRYRVDGALYEMDPPPRKLAMPVISRVKVMANLNIAERRLPQDGRIQRVIGGKPVDLRVSTLPTVFGESVVMRILDRSTVNLELESLGMPDYIYEYILETLHKPNGIFIVTGPTGSGKTTTLYSCLRKINTIDSKILTAEDPVEYEIEGLIQTSVQDSIGLTFARLLRAFLRQDPDCIMVGETRDIETAQIAIQAALTGHLVFTTLHTNDSTGAITRLVDMGVEPFLISAVLNCVLAQRLIRKICKACITSYEPTEQVLQQLGLSPFDIGDKNFYYGRGCETCNHTGYKGRKGIFELLKITNSLRELISQRAPGIVLHQKALEEGLVTLREDGLRSIYNGETTIEEVVKYT